MSRLAGSHDDARRAGLPNRRRWVSVLGATCSVSLIVAYGVLGFLRAAPVRGGVRTFALLIETANRGDVAAAARLCSSRYLAQHPLERASEGGLLGLPRAIDKNFSAWLQGPNVWICPTNRVGPVFQLVPDGPVWLFDGLVGELLPGREFVPADSEPDSA
jgi:hypothetical protein